MPIQYAALRQLRKDRKRRARNQAVRSALRTYTKRFEQLLGAKQWDAAQALLRAMGKAYDQAAVKGVIHRNTASRIKSRLTRRLNRLSAAR